MQQQFSDIINSQSGKVGFVLGLGSSLRQHVPTIMEWQKDKSKCGIISCNNIDLMLPEIDIDYWILAQPADVTNPLCIILAHDRYNSRPNTTLLYTDCLDLTPREQVARLLTGNYIGYDQRHYKSEPCGWGELAGGRHTCCQHIIEGRLCIQEEFKKYTGGDELYGNADTVGVHMVALAVMLGFKTIYISGIDLDYTNGYVNNNANVDTDRRIEMGKSVMANRKMLDRILDDMAIIKRSAEKVGTSIYCFNEGVISSVFEVKQPQA